MSRINRRVEGFGLIELMVAMAIGLLLTLGILTIYLDMSRSNAELGKTNLQIENGRLAIQMLRDELSHAGFWNGYIVEFDDLTLTGVPTDYPSALPAPCRRLVRPTRTGLRPTRAMPWGWPCNCTPMCLQAAPPS